ncbi:MAG TPA: glycosyltransferase family 1 protein [Candidatus Nanoarchaeia archaeon]|nr:D-inositol-3-phosphate glycosyltransferase [uncultured archaeon]
MHVGIDASRIALTERTGTENYSLNLIEAIKQVDKTNKYTLYFNNLPQYFEISQTNFVTRYIPLPRFWTQARLALECLIKPPDILFVPAHTLPLIHRPGLKTVVTIHDLGSEFLAEHHQFPQKLYLNASTRFAVSFATVIIAVSNSTKKDLVKRFGADPKKIKVIYEAVDQNFFSTRDRAEVSGVKLKYGLRRPYLLFVGTVQPRKNLELLIEAFSQTEIRNLDLVIAGKPGWLYEDIYKAPVKFGIDSRVKFLGFVGDDDLPALYSGALAFVLPSLFEGFGLPVLEAMSCGTPVIASRRSSLPEVVGEAGLLFNPRSKKELIAALLKVARDENLRRELIVAGRQQVKKFSWEKAARETVALFEKIYA